MGKLTAKQEAFAQKYVETGSATEAYRFAYDSKKMSNANLHTEACRLLSNPNISPRIEELSNLAKEVAKEKFTISIERRLKWLEEIVMAGMSKQIVMKGESAVEQRENLAAANKAIETLNSMLGTSDNDDDETKPITITFGVNAPVDEIKVTRGN